MDVKYKFIISRLNDNTILNYIENRRITFKNANRDIILYKNDINNIIFNMIKCGNPCDFFDNYSFNYLFKGSCSINQIHKDPLAQDHYIEILFRNESVIYCKNCIDMMIRFSNKMICKLGKFQYKKLRKVYMLIRKSSIYYFLDFDCFQKIFTYCLQN